MAVIFKIDDQPIAATFFGEVNNLTDFITPDTLEVTDLYKQLTTKIGASRDRILACWRWVANEIKYVKFVRGKIWIGGKSSVQKDLWLMPSMVIMTRIGNCANKSFLLTSLLRNELPAGKVFCALGNLYNGTPGGHAWIQINMDDEWFTMETTMPTAPPLIPITQTKRYEVVHFFNDQGVQAIEGRTQMIPFTTCYSTWLHDYLSWAYINNQ